MIRRALLMAAALANTTAIGASSQPSSQIDAEVTRLMTAARVTGTGVAVFENGKIAYLKAYGYRDTEKGLPLTANSVMTSASLSKAAFATMVMRLNTAS